MTTTRDGRRMTAARLREVAHQHGPATLLFAVSAACFATGVAIGAQTTRVAVRAVRDAAERRQG